MSGINQRYHAKNTVRLGGRKLNGWTPRDVARLLKRQEEQHKREKGNKPWPPKSASPSKPKAS